MQSIKLILGVLLCCSLIHQVGYAQDVTIPTELVVSRTPKPELPVIERGPFTLSSLSVGTVQQVFLAPPCISGNYHLGVQLYYDLGDTQTQVDWTADLNVTLLNGTTVVWTKPLNVRMSDQTFISTVFHTALISCNTSYAVRIENKNISGSAPQNNIYLKFLLYKSNSDVFVPATTAAINSVKEGERCTTTWSYSGKAVIAYDLEWVFIGDHENFVGTTAQQAFAFKEPVRITTAASHYSHLMYYPDGKIWYRVRAIGYNPAYPHHRIPGNWSYTTTSQILTNHESTINWQQQTVFAENGKYKKVMNYFDGSLRQRQMQTNLSTNGDTTVVGETLYDYEGRKSADILSVPSSSISLKYKPAFNQFVSQDAGVQPNISAKRKKFHYDNDILINSTISSTSGAGLYFSANNNNLLAYNKAYLPNAEGYVYGQVEYMNDGTGRVKRQAGVGKEYRMEGLRTTQYYYGTAAPGELIRLFGSNVGNANHYKKNLVVDANGQASISYLDQEGRTIATALGGVKPENVNPLESYSQLPSNTISVDLSQKNISQDGKSVTSHKILNTVPSAYTFTYDFSSLPSQVAGIGCVSCSYTLKIAITDPFGKLFNINSPPISGNEAEDGTYARSGISAECGLPDDPDAVFNGVSFTVNFSQLGDYTITKTIVPSELTFEQVDVALRANAVIQTKIQEIRDSYVVDESNCEICTTNEETQQVCPEAEQYIDEAIDEIASADCENIYQQIIQDLYDQNSGNLEYEPTETDITTHPRHCQYLLCLEDTESEKFEKKLARIYSWSQAVTAGYDVSLSNVNTQTAGSDPFFVNGNGTSSRSSMQGKLNAVTIPNPDLKYDSDGNGTPDTSFPAGTILNITDPTNTNYYITPEGKRLASGNHVLYYDLMSRRKANLMSETEYQSQLNTQRWVMFKMFYLEAKRKTKLQISKYSSCAPAKAELDRTDLLPTTESDIAAWGTANGVPAGGGLMGPVSDEELEAIVAAIKFDCGQSIDSTDSTTIANHLATYFNSNPDNFLRAVLRPDLTSNSSLIAINSLLNSKGCTLDSLAQDPLVCKSDTVIYRSRPNLIVNPNITRQYEGCQPVAITSSCYTGWDKVSGAPTTTGQHDIYLSGACCEPNSDAVRGTLAAPLTPGKTYSLCFDYRASPSNYTYAKIEFSRSTAYSPVDCSTQNFLAAPSQQQPFAVIVEPVCPSSGRATSRDQVIIDGSPWTLAWQAKITNMTYTHACVEFTATEASTYLFISAWSAVSSPGGVYIKDISLSELDSADSFRVCKEYFDSTAFSVSLDINQVVQKCINDAIAENEIITGYAIDRLIEDEATEFFSEQRTSCLSNLSEGLSYAYVPKEYHYTLYYYDQAGGLVQTVPPQGVSPLSPEQVNEFLAGNKTEPGHNFITRYQHNSLNQPIWQKTPDAGESRFWYDAKGQLRVSQNAQQKKDNNYSYTKYDEQGRITEVGEMNTTDDLAIIQEALEEGTFPLVPAYQLSDITKTFYDLPNVSIHGTFEQTNLRNRVSWVEVHEKDAADVIATYYSYDIHGNVNALLQQVPRLGHKRTDYLYDLVSGNVNYVMYQYGEPDQFIHRYKYDADNRLQEVATSTDGYLWNLDASYKYYLHGPLARVELGQYRVQGIDYYYTLQGWIKGVNMPYDSDPGNDGYAGKNLRVGKDVYSYALGYYENDYKPSNVAKVTAETRDQIWTRFNALMGSNHGLYNGNIAWMITDLKQVGQDKGSRAKGVQAMLYKYDQLHRIVQSRSLTAYSATGFASRASTPMAYDEDYTYDANGNILTLKRHNGLGNLADDFTYSYYDKTNKLGFHKPILRDTIFSGAIASGNELYRRVTIESTAYAPAGKDVVVKALEYIDFEEGGFNVESNATFHGYIIGDDEGGYVYDAIGNLILDNYNSVQISWTPYGKVRKVTKDDGTIVTFRYDGSGNRIEKKLQKPDNTLTITRYVRDASGNVMGVYSRNSLLEQPVYGSNRLGVYKGGSNKAQRKLGSKTFELSNHLGNVLSTVTDNIRMSPDSTWASVANATDYYPFGLPMQGRISSKGEDGNGALLLKGLSFEDNNRILTDISNNFTVEFWVNPTTTHQVDAQSTTGTAGTTGQKYAIHPAYGGTVASGEAGMGISVGTNGVSIYENAASYTPAILSWSGTLNGWNHIAVVYTNKQPTLYVNGVLVKTGLTSTKTSIHPSYGFTGSQYGTMDGSLDEIRIWNVAKTQAELQANYTNTIKRNSENLAGYWALNESLGLVAQDISEHGLDVPLPGVVQRSMVVGAPVTAAPGTVPDPSFEYRYGFNGKEKDDNGEWGNTAYDYGLRIYDPQIARFFSVDPLAYSFPWNSTYAFAENDVIRNIDLDGAEKLVANTKESQEFLNDYIKLMDKDKVLYEVGVRPFMSCNDECYNIYVVKSTSGWVRGSDGTTVSHIDKKLVKYARGYQALLQKQEKLKEYNRSLEEFQLDDLRRYSSMFKELGLSPEEVIKRDLDGIKQDVVIADDDYTIAHELILHVSDLLDGKNDESQETEHIQGHGEEYYRTHSATESPDRKDVDSKSVMGKIYNKMDRVRLKKQNE